MGLLVGCKAELLRCNFLGYRVQAKIFESVNDHPIYTYSLTLPPTYRSPNHSWTLTHPRKPFSKPPSPSPAYSWASNSNKFSTPTATASVIRAPPLCQQSHTKGHHVYIYQTIDGQQMFVDGQIDSWIWRMSTSFSCSGSERHRTTKKLHFLKPVNWDVLPL